MITVLNILLIEDNPGDIRLLQEILREVTTTRCQITPVMTLAAAVAQLSIDTHKTASSPPDPPSSFDIILLDLSLPDSQGLASFLDLHDRYPSIPIVVLTGVNDQTLAISAMQQGAQDYLIKGQVDSNLLLRSIRYAIERERTETALRQAKIELEQHAIERDRDLQQTRNRLQLELIERQKTEIALHITRSRFASILEIASDAIIAVDRDLQITLFNQGAEQIFGYRATDAIGQPLRSVGTQCRRGRDDDQQRQHQPQEQIALEPLDASGLAHQRSSGMAINSSTYPKPRNVRIVAPDPVSLRRRRET